MIDNYPSSSIPKIYLNEIKLILVLLLAKQESDLTTKLAKVNKIGALDVIDEIYVNDIKIGNWRWDRMGVGWKWGESGVGREVGGE